MAIGSSSIGGSNSGERVVAAAREAAPAQSPVIAPLNGKRAVVIGAGKHSVRAGQVHDGKALLLQTGAPVCWPPWPPLRPLVHPPPPPSIQNVPSCACSHTLPLLRRSRWRADGDAPGQARVQGEPLGPWGSNLHRSPAQAQPIAAATCRSPARSAPCQAPVSCTSVPTRCSTPAQRQLPQRAPPPLGTLQVDVFERLAPLVDDEGNVQASIGPRRCFFPRGTLSQAVW